MRSVLGALIGLVAASALVAVGGVALGGAAFWAVIVAGIVAGFAMRLTTGSRGSAYAKGALAALATAVAAVAGPLITTEWFRAQGSGSQALNLKMVAQPATDPGATDPEARLAADEVSPSPVAAPAFDDGRGVTGMRVPQGNAFATADILGLVVGCLVAYQLGKGPERRDASPADDHVPDDPSEPPQAMADGDSPSEGEHEPISSP